MSTVDRAAEQLLSMIAARALRPGDRLPAERDLAARLGLSRPALREAIRRLVDDRVVEARRGSGTYVAGVRAEDVFAVRRRLEPLAAALAADRATPAARRRLQELVAAMRETLDDAERFAALDAEVHGVVAAAADNPVLADALATLTTLTRMTRAISSASAPVRRTALADVERLVRAIVRSDAAAAEAAMTAHLDAVEATAARR